MTELIAKLEALSAKIKSLKEHITTEEATKTAFILPFIEALGYDVFNPTEVVPEFTADLGLKKGEKVDYAIFQNGDPILIIECKHWRDNLNVHNSQLFRYFHTTKTRFSVLTNGIEYRFYSDLDSTNKMDEKPFLTFNIESLRDPIIREIQKFHKSNFDVDKILTTASTLKYTNQVQQLISNELVNPSPDFIKFFTNKVYGGRLTERVVERFEDIVKRASVQIINEKINDRLTSALQKEKEQNSQVPEEPENKIQTTDEELESFQIIKAILRRKLSVNRISYRDTQSYLGILLDNNNRKPLCRLYLNGAKKYIGIFNAKKEESKHLIESIEHIYNFESQILSSISYYEENNNLQHLNENL